MDQLLHKHDSEKSGDKIECNINKQSKVILCDRRLPIKIMSECKLKLVKRYNLSFVSNKGERNMYKYFFKPVTFHCIKREFEFVTQVS